MNRQIMCGKRAACYSTRLKFKIMLWSLPIVSGSLISRIQLCACVMPIGLVCGVEVAQGAWQLACNDIFDGSSINIDSRIFDVVNGSGGWVNNEPGNASCLDNDYVTNGPIQSAANVSGPWSDTTDVTSSFVVTPNGARDFAESKFNNETDAPGSISPAAPIHFTCLRNDLGLGLGRVVSLNAQIYTPFANHRTDVVLNSNWQFIRQDVSGVQATRCSRSYHQSICGVNLFGYRVCFYRLVLTHQ